MASNLTNGHDGKPTICPVCIEVPASKIAGMCKHAFCVECLSSHIKTWSHGGEVFTCPTCHIDCPLPTEGVDGLLDYTGSHANVEDTGSEIAPEYGIENTDHDTVGYSKMKADCDKVRCQICYHKNAEVLAVNLCEACDDLYLCRDCTQIHGNSKATRGHVVTPVASLKSKTCDWHKELLKSYCLTCSEPVCKICVLINHGDHSIKKIGEVLFSRLAEMRADVGDQERRLKGLGYLEKDLTDLKLAALDKKAVLIKEIEDHAQSCVDIILEQKNDLKKQVEKDFSVISEVNTTLKRIACKIRKMRESVNKATGLLSKIAENPKDLNSLQPDTRTFRRTLNYDCGGEFTDDHWIWKHFLKLRQLNIPRNFVTKNAKSSLGKLQMEEDSFQPNSIFEQHFKVEDKSKFISSLTIVGKKYFAVAHPSNSSKKSNAIDIYEFPNTFLKTLENHVFPVYDMAATPDGLLAVLSGGCSDGVCCVRTFHPITGCVRSSGDFFVCNPLSLGTTIDHQYVILCDSILGQKQITIVNEDGAVNRTHLLPVDTRYGLGNPSRISCGGRYVYVMGETSVAVYMLRGTKHGSFFGGSTDLELICTIAKDLIGSYYLTNLDITSTIRDELCITYQSSGNMYLSRLFNTNKFEYYSLENNWSASVTNLGKYAGRGRVTRSRVSMRDDYIVLSQGSIFMVYT